MRDKEIVEALECCLEDGYEHCSKCPYYDKVQCTFELMSDALDLINRLKRESNSYRNKAKGQKGELARLNKQVADLTEKLEALGDPLQDAQYKIAEQQAEIARLNKEAIKQQLRRQMYRSTVDEIKAEAIKEFAERYEKIKTDRLICSFCCFKDGVDNLVKEMVGDAE